jgi:hypothetical protein
MERSEILGRLKKKDVMFFPKVCIERFYNGPECSLHFPMAQQPAVGQDLLIIDASRSHSDTPQSVGLLWTSDQPVAETST